MANGEVYLKWKPVGIAGKDLYIKKEWVIVADELNNVIGDGAITDTYDPKYVEDWRLYSGKEGSFVRCYISESDGMNRTLRLFRTWGASSKQEDIDGTFPNNATDDQRIDYFQFWLYAKVGGTWYYGQSIPSDGIYVAAINPPNISFTRIRDNINIYYPNLDLNNLERDTYSTLNPFASYKPDNANPNGVNEWIGYSKSQRGNVEVGDLQGGYTSLPWNYQRTIKYSGFRWPVCDIALNNLTFKLVEDGVTVKSEVKDLSSQEWGLLEHTVLNESNNPATVNKNYEAEIWNGSTLIDRTTFHIPFEGIPILLEITNKARQDGNTAKVEFRVKHTFPSGNYSFKLQVGWYSGSYYDWTGYLDNNQGLVITNLAKDIWSNSIYGLFDGAYNIDYKPFALRLVWAEYGQHLNNYLEISDSKDDIIPYSIVGNASYLYNDFYSWLIS